MAAGQVTLRSWVHSALPQSPWVVADHKKGPIIGFSRSVLGPCLHRSEIKWFSWYFIVVYCTFSKTWPRFYGATESRVSNSDWLIRVIRAALCRMLRSSGSIFSQHRKFSVRTFCCPGPNLVVWSESSGNWALWSMADCPTWWDCDLE